MKDKTKQNQRNKRKFNSYTKKEEGVTLVALIVTIVIMVIIAAVSIMAVYNSKIVEHAINGTLGYAGEEINENKVLEGTESKIESTVNRINDIIGGNEPEESNPEEPIPPEPKELTVEELSQDVMIGRYVDYKPQGTDYTVDGTYSGTESNQTFAKNDDMKWRIWGVEDNKLLLISETLAENITLKGANGYNNGVKILNDACATAFGNSSYDSAIKVRSINQDDIDKVTNMTTDAQRKDVNSNYGSSYTPSKTNWPNIYGQELGNNNNGGENLDRSSQSSWITGTTNSSFNGKCTIYYNYAISSYITQTMYDALLTNPSANSTSGTDDHANYYVATRCVYFDSNAYFYTFGVCNGKVWIVNLYGSWGYVWTSTCAVRPVVEVNLDSVEIGATGTGTADNAYSIAMK